MLEGNSSIAPQKPSSLPSAPARQAVAASFPVLDPGNVAVSDLRSAATDDAKTTPTCTAGNALSSSASSEPEQQVAAVQVPSSDGMSDGMVDGMAAGPAPGMAGPVMGEASNTAQQVTEVISAHFQQS